MDGGGASGWSMPDVSSEVRIDSPLVLPARLANREGLVGGTARQNMQNGVCQLVCTHPSLVRACMFPFRETGDA